MTPQTIGSSDVAAILGLSPWSSPMQVWARLTGLAERSDADSPQLRRGRILEAGVREERERVLKKPVTAGPIYGLHEPLIAPTPNEWAHCRPDSWYPGETGLILIEVKTTRKFDDDDWGDDGTSDVPVYYAAQCVWQMGVMRLRGSDIEGCELVAFCAMNDEFRTYYLPFDQALFDRMFAKVDAWRLRYVVGGEIPPADGSEATSDILKKVYPGGVDKVVIDPTDADTALARQLRDVKEQIKTLEATELALGNTLRQRIGDANATEIKGCARWTPTKGRLGFDTKALEAEYPAIYQQFVKIGAPYRTLTITLKD